MDAAPAEQPNAGPADAGRFLNCVSIGVAIYIPDRSSSGIPEDDDEEAGVEDQDDDDSEGCDAGGVEGLVIPSTIPLTAPTPEETT